MRIAIIGAGAVGGYFGARLAQAGNEVVFLARGRQLEALRTQGLRIDSPMGDLRLHPVQATDTPDQMGIVETVLVCVKAWQVPELAPLLTSLVGKETCFLPLENGVEAVDQLAAVHGDKRVLGGLCKIISKLVGPGHIQHIGVEPYIALGELDNKPSERLHRLMRVLKAAGVVVDNPPDIQVALWNKFMMMCGVAGTGSVTRSDVGTMRSTPETRRLLADAMQEVQDLARALGIALPVESVRKALEFVDTLPPEGTSSMQRDIAEGRPSELESLNGAVVRLAAGTNLDTPVNRFIHASLLPMESRARQKASS